MTFLNRLFWIGLAVSLLSACSKVDHTPTPTPMYYSYFPLKTGLTRIYQADSVNYLTIHQFASYQLKEVFASTFVNGAGETVYRIERYTRPDTNSNWSALDVITQRNTNLEALQTEGNNTFVKLIFPVKSGADWDFNKYNTTDSLHYYRASYANVHQPLQLGTMHFDSTVQVNYIHDSSLVNSYHYFERYAAGIGMINKYDRHLDIQPAHDGKPADTSGYLYRQVLIQYSK